MCGDGVLSHAKLSYNNRYNNYYDFFSNNKIVLSLMELWS